MKTVNSSLLALVTLTALATAAGCEIAVKLDENKIPRSTTSSTSTGMGGTGGIEATVNTVSSVSSTAEVSSSSASSSGSTSTGGCDATTACPTPPECEDATCNDMICGTKPSAPHTACTDGVCDGSVHCIGCVDATDCPTPASDCITAVCDAGTNTCTTKNVTIEGACNSSGGQVCDGNGACIGCISSIDCNSPDVCNASNVCVPPACNDKTQDGHESDTDCGGTAFASGCPTCDDTDKCLENDDCTSGFCSGALTCAPCDQDSDCGDTTLWCNLNASNGGTCTKVFDNGTTCTATDQCSSGKCVAVTGGTSLCCDSNCTDGCSSCLGAETNGGVDGTCDFVKQGKDPKSVCDTTGTDCFTGFCDGLDACDVKNSGTSCGNPTSCTGTSLMTQTTCKGTSGNCPAQTGVTCPDNLACTPDGTACLTACSVSGAPPGGTTVGCGGTTYCDTTTNPASCQTTQKDQGRACNNSIECSSGSCESSKCACDPAELCDDLIGGSPNNLCSNDSADQARQALVSSGCGGNCDAVCPAFCAGGTVDQTPACNSCLSAGASGPDYAFCGSH